MTITQLTRETVPTLPKFGMDPDAEQKRNDLLLQSSQFKVAASVTDANSVGEAARDIRSHIKAVREMGMGLRRPLKKAADSIKAIEDDYCAPLEAEQARLEAVAGAWHASERKRIAAEEAKQREELARLDREAEAARALAQETQDADAVKMAAEAALAVTAQLYAPKPEARRVSGMATRRVPKWELVDIHALYKARPDLCRIEPNAGAIRAVCVPKHPPTSGERDETSVPGLRQWWADETVTRAW